MNLNLRDNMKTCVKMTLSAHSTLCLIPALAYYLLSVRLPRYFGLYGGHATIGSTTGL